MQRVLGLTWPVQCIGGGGVDLMSYDVMPAWVRSAGASGTTPRRPAKAKASVSDCWLASPSVSRQHALVHADGALSARQPLKAPLLIHLSTPWFLREGCG